MTPDFNRRQFLRHAVATAALSAAFRGATSSALLAAPQGKTAVDDTALPIVDTHQHLWDLSKFNVPWTKGHPKFDRSFVMSDYLDASKGTNVVKTVYMEVDLDPNQQVQDNSMASRLLGSGDSATVESSRETTPLKGVY